MASGSRCVRTNREILSPLPTALKNQIGLRVEEEKAIKAPEPARWMLEALGGDQGLPCSADRQKGATGDPQKPQAEQPKPGEL